VRAAHRPPRRRLARHRGRRDEGLRLTRERAEALTLSPASSGSHPSRVASPVPLAPVVHQRQEDCSAAR
jgi:hypothetical protein